MSFKRKTLIFNDCKDKLTSSYQRICAKNTESNLQRSIFDIIGNAEQFPMMQKWSLDSVPQVHFGFQVLLKYTNPNTLADSTTKEPPKVTGTVRTWLPATVLCSSAFDIISLGRGYSTKYSSDVPV